MAHLPVTGYRESTGELRATYEAMMARPLPAVYRPGTGDAPGIIRAHSLDAGAMRTAFKVSGHLNGNGPLAWHEREFVNATTSRLNQCFY